MYNKICQRCHKLYQTDQLRKVYCFSCCKMRALDYRRMYYQTVGKPRHLKRKLKKMKEDIKNLEIVVVKFY